MKIVQHEMLKEMINGKMKILKKYWAIKIVKTLELPNVNRFTEDRLRLLEVGDYRLE